jgi:predicted RNA polymerase sigma factor
VAERAARDRVQRAKTALGERGTPWWEQTSAERRARWQAGLEQDRPSGSAPP